MPRPIFPDPSSSLMNAVPSSFPQPKPRLPICQKDWPPATTPIVFFIFPPQASIFPSQPQIPQPSQPPFSPLKPTDLLSSTDHNPRPPLSAQTQQGFLHWCRPASSKNPRCLLHLLPTSLVAASPSHHSNTASSLITMGLPRQICHRGRRKEQ